MSKIVESYVEFDEMFKKIHSNSDLSLDDLRYFRNSSDNFVKAAKERYANKDLDLLSALRLFFSDSIAQEELKQHTADLSDEGKKKQV